MVDCSKMEEFRRFDEATDESDHYYLTSNRSKKNDGGDAFTKLSSTVYKKIMQEWKILERDLPESIIVRAYEQRIDLLRAVIVGAAGTPYHDGLFFFDLAFPSDYPNSPPKVYYHSFGLRLNPNLYASGRVCLSLLNTWTGKKNEKWNPSTSTVLQVLVSIQGLVLNEKPYFNEPGLGGWPGRAFLEKNSRAYNEDVFAYSCKTMMFLLRRPPKNFESFVVDHFRKRAHTVLNACRGYTYGGVRIGYYRDDSSSSSSSSSSNSPVKVSNTFKASMEQLYPQLVSAFTNNGSSILGILVNLKEVNNNRTISTRNMTQNGTVALNPLPAEVIEKNEEGSTKKQQKKKKIIDKIKQFLGMKKGKP